MGRSSDVTRRACGFKVGVSGGANRRVTVSAVKANGRPLVHLKVRTGIGEGSNPSYSRGQWIGGGERSVKH
jgi:hypothetical protein